MHRLPITIACVLLQTTAVLTGCQRAAHDTPVPRRTAYHRLDLPPATYRDYQVMGRDLSLNSAVDSIEDNGEGWITAYYPDALATLYITVTPLTLSTAPQAIDNRVERLSLNTGGAPTEITNMTTHSGLDGRVMLTPAGSPTPVQILVTDHRSVLISGSASVPQAATAPRDSLSPVTEMLYRDMLHIVESL